MVLRNLQISWESLVETVVFHVLYQISDPPLPPPIVKLAAEDEFEYGGRGPEHMERLMSGGAGMLMVGVTGDGDCKAKDALPPINIGVFSTCSRSILDFLIEVATARAIVGDLA